MIQPIKIINEITDDLYLRYRDKYVKQVISESMGYKIVTLSVPELGEHFPLAKVHLDLYLQGLNDCYYPEQTFWYKNGDFYGNFESSYGGNYKFTPKVDSYLKLLETDSWSRVIDTIKYERIMA